MIHTSYDTTSFSDIVQVAATYETYIFFKRCGQITIDQKVGVMSEDREPLKTLLKYV